MGYITKDNKVENFSRRKYNDKRERAGALNSTLLIGINVFYLIICIYAGYELSKGIQKGINSFVIIASIVFIGLNCVIYFKNRYSYNLHIIATYAYLLVYAVTLIACKNEFMQYTIIAVLVIVVLFYETKRMLLFSLIAGIINIIHFSIFVSEFYKVNSAIANSDVGAEILMNTVIIMLLKLLFMFALLYTVIRTSSRADLFNKDIVGTISDEQEKQKEILDEVLVIATIIRENASASNEIVQELGASTGVVNLAVSQISASTQLTAENIQEQNIMTQSIQTSINETVKRSKKMVALANESNSSIDSSLEVMNDLRVQSDTIVITNKDLIDSMNSLQEKTKEVQDIANIIFNISNQTNLLALNASIESARAGEAGRGFAVVANQIRILAEQTKSSTESIARIIQELNNYAEAATNTVNDTIVSTNYQGELITTASDSFGKINQNVSILANDIDSIDKMLVSLANANNTIVENISQISATTEEVTASAEEATAISDKNAQDANNAKKLLKEVIETSHRLNKYMGK